MVAISNFRNCSVSLQLRVKNICASHYFLCKLAGREVPQWETPVELKDRVAELLTGYEPANEREKNVIHMLHYYHPDETADEQVKELIGWGYDEQRLWQIQRK